MLPKQPILTPRLVVRAFRPEDANDLYAYLSDARVYEFEPGEPIDLDGARRMAAEMACSPVFWAVELKAEGRQIGQIYFNLNEPARFMTWELGYIFNPAYHRQGYGAEAAAALVRYGFSSGQIHRIVAHCNPANTASWKLLEKIGFQREGWLRQENFFRRSESGAPLWTDTLVYARLASD